MVFTGKKAIWPQKVPGVFVAEYSHFSPDGHLVFAETLITGKDQLKMFVWNKLLLLLTVAIKDTNTRVPARISGGSPTTNVCLNSELV